MDFKDYYKILGIERSASQEDIKRVYKKLARKYHPDVSKEPDATLRFQEVGEAYEVLKQKDKRAEYDDLYDYVNNPGKYNKSSRQFEFGSGFSPESQFEDLLKSIFGDAGNVHNQAFEQRAESGGFQSQGFGARPEGKPAAHDLTISLEEAFHGGSRQIRLSGPDGERTIKVKVPKGVSNSKELRLKGQGELLPGNRGRADLYLKLRFSPHPTFTVDGNDIILNLPVSPWEAALGENVQIPTLGGKVNLKIPANSSNGQKLKLKGRGLKEGNQIVILKIVNPPVRTAGERAAFEQLKQAFSFNPREVARPSSQGTSS